MPKKRIAVAVALALGAAVFEAESQSISSTALPSGGRVVGGEAAIRQQGAAMAVDQASARAAIDWQSFSIGSQASVTFNQPSASAIALNRVIGTNGSEILGRLSANGQIFLVNPNGVLFGRGAQVDVGGLLASTLNTSVDDFMAGRYVLHREGEPRPVVNEGTIRTTPRGYVALVAPSVVNRGSVESPLGTVSLAAGNAATVDFMADGLVKIRVDEGTLQAEVANHGALLAEGGYVLLTARALDSLARAVVNNTGIVEARSVKILGDEVILSGTARIDASGETGGGEILIGGNYQGRGPEHNASRTYVGPGVTIAADAITSGDGGRVIVWSNESTQFHGSISARGGAQAGNGGFVETSGATLQVTGTVDTSAPNGAFGTWLLDPAYLIVAAGGVDLFPGINDTFASNVAGTTIINPASINSALANVVLQANTDVEFRDPVDIAGRRLSLTAQAGRSILVNASIRTNEGNVSLTANDDSVLVVPTDRQAGAATVSMAPGTTIDAGNGDISLRIGTGCALCFDKTTGDVRVERLSARSVGIHHEGQTGSIVRASDSSLIRARQVLMDIEFAAGPTSSIGTRSQPIRISADKLEAQYRLASGGIFIESPEARDLQIGGADRPFGSVRGVEAGDASVGSGGGPVEIRVNGNLIQQAGPAGCGIPAGSGGPICSVDGPITLTASGAMRVESFIQTSNASADAVVLSAGHGTAAGDASGGDIMIGPGAVLSFGPNGRATLYTGSIAGSSGVTGLVGAGSGKFRYNSSPSSTGYTAPPGAGIYAIYRERPTLTVIPDSQGPITYGTAPAPYTFTLTGLQNGDTAAQALTALPGVTDDGRVSTSLNLTSGSHALTASGAVDQLGYNLAYVPGTMTVDPATISVAGITASNKVYDATTAALVDTTGATFTGVISPDVVVFDPSSAVGLFADKNVGVNKLVTVTGLVLAGADAINYVVTDNSGATASITPATIAAAAGITANNKAFDGTTSASLNTGTASFIGMFSGDALAVATATGSFVDPNVGTAKTVNISGITLGGSDAGNYILASNTASATADIVPANKGFDAGSVATTSTPAVAPVASIRVEPSSATALRISDGPAMNTAAVRQFTAPTWQALSDLWELRHKKLLAIDSAVGILERDPDAADLPDCEAEISVHCIAKRGLAARRPATEQPSPKFAHAPQIIRKVALLIGVADYRAGIPKLGSPLKDVQEIGKLYADRFGYDVRILPDADKATIVRELNRLILESGPNDSVTVFYAGHGHVVEKTGRGYWIPAKASPDEPSQWISNQDIGKFLARIPANQVLLVSDSCYSGMLARDAKVHRAEVASDPSAVLERRSVTVLSSGGEEPVADSGKDGHSVFAWHFIRSAAAVEGLSKGIDVYEQLAERVKQDFPQEPQYGAAVASGHEIGGDFLFEVRRY